MPPAVPRIPPLVPGVKGSLYRRDDPFAEDAREEFSAVRMKIVRRDNFTCVYCGLRTQGGESAPDHSLAASGGLHVHHIDDNHGNNSEDNLISVCPLCHMIHHIGFAAQREYCNFIYLPEIRQEDLNILLHCIAVAQSRQENLESERIGRAAWEIYYALDGLKRIDITGTGNDLNADPTMLGTALAGILHEHPETYAKRADALHGLRVLYDFKKMDLSAFFALPCWLPGPTWTTSWRCAHQTLLKGSHG